MKFGDFIFCTHDMCVWLLVAPRLGVNWHPIWYHGKKSQNPFKLFLNSKKISHALDYSGILWVQIWHVFGLHMATTKRPDSKRWWYQPTWVLDMGAGSPWPFTQCKPIATALTGLELVNFAAQPQHVASPLLSSPLPLAHSPSFLIFHLLRSFFTHWHKLQFVFPIEIHCPLTHLWYYPRLHFGVMEARDHPPPPPSLHKGPSTFVFCELL